MNFEWRCLDFVCLSVLYMQTVFLLFVYGSDRDCLCT